NERRAVIMALPNLIRTPLSRVLAKYRPAEVAGPFSIVTECASSHSLIVKMNRRSIGACNHRRAKKSAPTFGAYQEGTTGTREKDRYDHVACARTRFSYFLIDWLPIVDVVKSKNPIGRGLPTMVALGLSFDLQIDFFGRFCVACERKKELHSALL